MNESRIYYGTDAEFIENCSKSIRLITANHSKFEAISVNFTPETLSEIVELQKRILNIPRDTILVSIQAKATEEVKQQLKKCGQMVNHLKFEMAQVFADDELMFERFEFSQYKLARKSARRMIMFLTHLHDIAVINQSVLIENGCTQNYIDGIEHHRDILQELMLDQKQCMFERNRATQIRVKQLNQLYRRLSRYNKMAHYVFKEDWTILEYFRFLSPPKSKTKVEIPHKTIE